jgi:CTP synthase
MQVAVVEFARNALGLEGANSTEFDPQTPNPVIDLMPTQRQIADKGGTMRLGNWVCCLTPGTKAQQAYGEAIVFERHRHRYEFNNEYRKRFEAHGMKISGRSADNSLVEIIELANHPWFVASQFHPEFKSRPTRPHPLFRDFIGACLLRQNEQQQDDYDAFQREAVGASVELAEHLPLHHPVHHMQHTTDKSGRRLE